jgi:methyltransferase (TIGR00027 family)
VHVADFVPAWRFRRFKGIEYCSAAHGETVVGRPCRRPYSSPQRNKLYGAKIVSVTEPVLHVSDTARWVAVYRAWESARPDALFRDPFAERLAGEHGKAIAQLMPRQARSGWPLIVRTYLIDQLILRSIEEGCDCVINLAAGLDTRPYRMPLPASLQWIEVDFPAMIEEKQRLLGAETPVCRLSRYAADLADPVVRADLLDRIAGNSIKTLVVSEGLLVYLDEDVVRDLANDLMRQQNIHWWIFDLASPGLLKLMSTSMGQHLTHAPMKFAPADGVAFFEALGWHALQIQSFFRAAARLHRLPLFLRPFALFPEPNPRRPGNARWSAAVRLMKDA